MKADRAMKKNRRGFLQAAAATLALSSLPFAACAASAASGKMRIGIVGSGRVGGTLGTIWANAGHTVMLSSLDLEHDKALAASIGANARAGTPREAAAFGEVLLISVPYHALPRVGKDLGALLKGKIVIDTCNPFPGRDGEIGAWAQEKGAGLASAELLPGARIVRAFNAVGSARLPEAAKREPRAGMPIAGDDAKAIEVASSLVRDVGYEPVLIGPLAMGKHLVPRTPLAGERSPEEIRKIAATLN
ncbi:MAG: NADPH-dependent F420 reductase [Betaproteobacteria bacterium]|nr:NADPH-dependent F420 reductase [Betaproteobacteria bacterium]